MAHASNEDWFERVKLRHCAECHVNRLLHQMMFRCIRFMLADEEDLEGFLPLIENGTTSLEMLLLTLEEIVRKKSR